jgi:hypothetical protein
MSFLLGIVSGMCIMYAMKTKEQTEVQKQLEKLKDFDTWKEWKNK